MNENRNNLKLPEIWKSDSALVWMALGLLVVISAVMVPGTLSSSGLLAMAPFAAVLAIASIGQCLTIQSGGMDLSVAGSMTVAAAVVTAIADRQDGRMFTAIAIALVVAIAAGVLNGVAITVLRIPPIVVTLAVNAILVGAVQSISGGVLQAVPADLADLAGGKTAGIPNTVLLAIVFVVLVAAVATKSVVGRRLTAVGAQEASARAAGIAVSRYIVGTYAAAGFCYGCAGVVLAGYLQTPATTMADTYLFSTITAVIIGGTAFGGGRGRIIGTALGAVFVSQLNVFLAATGAPASITYLVQAAAIAIAVLINNREALTTAQQFVKGVISQRGRTVPVG